MRKNTKPMSDIEITQAFAMAPVEQRRRIEAAMKMTMRQASMAMNAMYATQRCKEFIDKFVSTPSGDALGALVQVVEQEGPSRNLGRVALPTGALHLTRN